MIIKIPHLQSLSWEFYTVIGLLPDLFMKPVACLVNWDIAMSRVGNTNYAMPLVRGV
jgi:hypothetical protein